MKPASFLALDFGTSGSRVAIFDDCGVPSWHATDPGGVGGTAGAGLLDPGEVQESLTRLLRVAAVAVPAGLNGIGVSAQLGMVLLDATGKPLAPITTWRDRSAVDEADSLKEDLGAAWIYRTAGRRVDPELVACKLLRLRRQHPEVFRRIRWVLSLKDYLVFLLTGAHVVDPVHASYSMLADVSRSEWSPDLLRAVGMSRECLPPICPGVGVAGKLTAMAARQTGLPQGVPVAVGGPDGTVGAVGAGMVCDGSAVDVMGTSDVLLVATDRPCFHPQGATLVNAHVLPGLWAAGGPMTTTGGALHWLAEHLLGEPPEKVGARLAVLEETARSVAPGSDGLVGIPSLIGERAPLWDPRMRGAFFGLGLQHRPAHLYRALVEGAAFLLAIHLEALHSAGAAVDRLILAGGGSRSALACGIRSEVLGRPISVCATPQTTALGAALLASIASGCHPDAETASAAMCRTGEVLVVPAERQEQYQRCLRRFRDVYAALAGIAK